MWAITPSGGAWRSQQLIQRRTIQFVDDTLTIHQGCLDEVSYLSTNHTSIEEALSLLGAALESADHTAKSRNLTGQIGCIERLPIQREWDPTWTAEVLHRAPSRNRKA